MLRLRFLTVLALSSIACAPLAAQQGALALVSAKSAIIVQIHGWERTLGRLNAVLKTAAPDYAPLISGQIESGIASALMGREIKGLAKDGPLLLSFPEIPTGDAGSLEVSLVAKVDNYVEFRDAILKDGERKGLKANDGYEATKIEDHEVFFINKGDFVVVTPSEKIAKQLVKKDYDSIAGKLSKDVETKLMNSDISVYVDMAAVNSKFADQITMAKTMMDQALQGLEGQAGLEKTQIELMKKIYAGMFQFVEDSEQFVAAAEFPPEGLLLKLQTQVGEKSKTNEWFAGVTSAPFSILGKLPSGAMVYSGGTMGQSLVKGNAMLMMGQGAGLGGAKEDKAVREAAEELERLKIKDWAAAGSIPTSGFQALEYENPTQAVATMLKMYQGASADSSLMGMAIKGKPEVVPAAQKFNGYTLNAVSYEIDLDKIIESVPEQTREMTRNLMKKMVSDKQHIWFGTDGKTVVQMTAADWKAAQAMLAKYAEGKTILSSELSFAHAAKHLPERSSIQVLIDAAKYAETMYDMVGETLKLLGIGADKKMKAPEGPPQYLGLAVGLESRSGSLDVWIPAKGIRDIISMVQPLLGGGN